LHPASLDAAFHALFDLVAEDDGAIKTWLPIRFERLSVWKANAHVTSASLRVDENGDKLKIVSLWLFDADGELVARLDRALLKAVVHAWVSANRGVYHLSHQPAGRIGDETLFGRVHRYFEEHDLPVVSDAWNLMEAHRQAALHEALLTRSDDDGRIDLPNDTKVDTIISAQIDGVIDSALRSGILRRADGVLTLDEDIQHPSAEIILASVLAEFPEAAVDVGLSAQMAADLPRLLAGEQVPLPRVALLQQYETSSLRYAPIKKAIAGCLAAISAEIEDPIHIVVDAQHGMAAASELLSHAARGTIRLSLVAEDSSVAQRIANRLPVRPETEIIDLSKANTPCADIVFAFGVEVSSPAEGQMSALSRLLVPGGVLVTLAYPVDDLVTFHRGCAVREQVMHPAFHSDTPENVANIENHASFGDAMSGLSVRIAQRRAVVGRTVRVCALGGNSCGIITELCGAGIDAAAFSENEVPDDPFDLVWFADDGELALNALIMDLQAKLLGPARNSGATRIWVVARGSGVSGALRGFARVAMNEMADIDLRFIELADGVGLDMAALALAMLASESSVEREWRLTHVGLEVPRLQRGLSLTKVVEGGADHALRLNFPRPGMLEHFDWVSGERTAPGYGEVELEVIATGLNFRDVMLAMGMLDDDVLEAGLAGSVFGLECAGRVVRLGTGVTRLSEGDVVVGFAQSCFTSHVVASEHSLVLVPDGMPPEAAAGLPVPFLTAWYALEELARIKPGETVLVHGGAGAVGLAAIQIARDLGVTVIATVSSPDKEALARLFGAQFVYNSRTLEFVDQVRENHGGVDAVLNSLAGDAMRGGIKCLRSRGRFIELGKRDYVANSLIPLRAFRRNLSYFGVDIDQVLDLEPSVAKRGIEAVFEAIKEERYLPLPVNVHEPNQISQAFRLMQASGHVGKIVIKAPDSGRGEEGKDTAFDPGGGVQLVVGGTRGFGLATALWLAEKGAEKIVVASRSGKLDPDYADRVDALRRDGIVFDVASLDVGDASAVQELINDIVSQYGPITGVWNTAVSLHDAMIESLEEAKVDQVLEAKVSGSEILHLATLDQPLEQFVLFSSVSALIGNPGQGAYAAANGYMEGLVCRRRAEGRPALAIEWGAILDVGLLADNVETMESLARFSGVSGLTSNEALARLEAVLVKTQRLSDPVVALCDFSVNGGLRGLPVAISPAFAGLLANGSSSAGGEHKSLAEQIVGKSEAEAQRIILDILAREVAKIMRLAVEDVNLDESIDNLGMDSLMAVELRMTIENVCAIELSMMAISAVSNLRELANRILRLVSGSEAGNEEQPLTAVETELLATHGGTTSHVE